MILSAQSIRKAKIIEPFYERTIVHGMSFGLGPNGYDVRIDQELVIPPKCYALASTLEYFNMPHNIMARVADKSTWARRFLSVFNTTIDAGWKGYLTLELVNHSHQSICISEGSPIAKIVFERLDETTEIGYDGAYQYQQKGGQPPAIQQELPGVSDGPLFNSNHIVRKENDEYACSCGKRWDSAEGNEHP